MLYILSSVQTQFMGHYYESVKSKLKAGWWFGTWILFFHILGITIPTDELIFLRGLGIPPTRKCEKTLFFHDDIGSLLSIEAFPTAL